MGFTEVLRLIQSAQNYTTLLSAPYCRMDKLSHLHHSHYFLDFLITPYPLFVCKSLCILVGFFAINCKAQMVSISPQ